MQPLQHQMMGYDRTSTMFSPDGRLLQVEYAKKTVKQGTSAIGLVCKDGVVLVADKRITEPLIVSDSVEKVYQVDDHIGVSASGILSDGRALIDKARLMSQQHQLTYDHPISVASLVKDVCDLKQAYTQFGGARPFGVSLLFIGVDEKPTLYTTDPTGIFFEYKATAIGEAEAEIKAILVKEYKENITIEDGIKMAVKILKRVLGKEFDIKRIDSAYVSIVSKKFVRPSHNHLKRLLK